ncbi:MAG: Ig-like domain-containing protein, partial [Limisphaerales bacterium]
MKTPSLYLKAGWLFILTLVILTCGTKVLAQTTDSNLIPIVTVQATQPIATVSNAGVFTVFRTGNTNAALNVWYELGGTASNGVDYALISYHWVTIDAGATSNTIVITPIESAAASIVKTIVLTLTNSPLLTPVNYEIGSPSGATVYIVSGGSTNLPPSVSIIEPKAGEVFYTPTNIQLLAKATDPDGSITHVEFFAGTNDLGSGMMVVLDPPGVNGVTGPVWFFNWQNPSPGNYPLTAVAADNGGASTVSDPVNITVLQGPPTNLPPVVRIISPANGSIFRAPINIPLFAFASDPDGSVTSVQYFDGTNSLGFGQPIPLPVAGSVPPVYPTNIFSLVWSNAPVGNHV